VNDNLHFDNLQKSLEAHLQLMEDTARAIIDQDISNYPIFLVNETTPALGINILAFSFEDKQRIMSATTLEELATKGVVEMEKVNDFKDIYKKNDPSFCLLIVEENEAKFIFLPNKG
jgi:hypothetical protein